MVDISIVVPVYNEEDHIVECLDSISRQNLNREYEVITIDDGSEDRSLEILRSYSGFEDHRVIENEENQGYSSVLDQGLKEARGEVIVYIDADTVLSDGALKRLSESILEEGNGAFFGRVEVRDEEGLHSAYARAGKEDAEKPYGGAFMGFRREYLLETGGVSKEGGKWTGTDDELMTRSERNNWGTVYDDEAVVYSSFPSGMEVAKKKYLSGKTYVRSKIKHPEEFDLLVTGNLFYLLALVSTGLGSFFSIYSAISFFGLIIFDLTLHTRKAWKIYANSGKLSYYFLYFLYGFASDILRGIGLLTEIKRLTKVTYKRLKL